jgi:hypothetical protein
VQFTFMSDRGTIRFLLMAGLVVATGGCSSMWHPNTWPFPEYDQTSYRTPSMRVDAVRQFAQRSTGVDSPEQQKLTDQLARQIQIEPDPLVRLAVIETIAEFRTPMAQQVLEAGLDDDDEAVRIASCKQLGKREDQAAIPKLAAALRSDPDINVRLAATAALGKMKAPEAMPALWRARIRPTIRPARPGR